MSSTTRRAYDGDALVQWIITGYEGTRSFFLRKSRYEPLSQDPLSLKSTTRYFRGSPRRVLAYIAAALSVVVLIFVVYHSTPDGSSLAATEGVNKTPSTPSLPSSLSEPSPTTSSLSSSPTTSLAASSRADISKDDFIAAVLRDPVEGLLDLGPIQKKCNETKFQDGLIWQCAPVNGGIGNVVNMVLNCVRYAVEAGATTLILPQISIRADNLIDLNNKDQTAEMSYLLDANYFLESWKQACPQMRALISVSDSSTTTNTTPDDATGTNINNNIISSYPKADLSPNRVKAFEMRKYLIVDPTGWREAFDEWMAKNPIFETMSTETPVRVWQNLAFAQWNRLAHSPEFGNSFPRLFRHLPQARRLAASALWNLEKKMGRPAVADNILFPPETMPSNQNQSIVNSLGPDRLASGGFLGAHLRVAADAAAAGWPGYDAQAPFYISEAKARNLSDIYLATGSAENRDRFRKDAALEGLTVHVKEELLDEEELAELKKLTWDQQALVDFEVLMHSAMFYGFVRSSYSWALVLRRGTLPEAGIPVWSEGEHEYWDNLSAIAGRYGSINPEGLWP